MKAPALGATFTSHEALASMSHMSSEISWVQAMNPRDSKLNLLLIALPITLYYAYIAHNESMSFVFSLLAIMPLAFLMGSD